ncbi:MAG: DegV family protein, partial [Firmicutes bacterium]|nr:DegV family protein [Bacillota bacterium]
MSNYLIMSDSGCDICPELLAEWGVKQIQMSFMFENAQFDDKNNLKGFYDCMRQGGIAKTAAINPDTFYNEFKSVLTDGLDILYLAFSSGLSTTCNSAKIAAEELAEEFPDRKIAIVDSLCASAGQGMLIYLVNQKRNEYDSVDQLAAYAESIKMNICHWFTVDDLVYLKRGGRVSPTVAFVGGVLGIKPVLHVDNEGHLISVSKVRGRAASIAALAKKYGELAQDTAGGTV